MRSGLIRKSWSADLGFTKFFGGNSEEVPPVPIPNTEVKLFSADGTAWETMWESRSPPNSFKKPLGSYELRGFFFSIQKNHLFHLPCLLFTSFSLSSVF